MWHGFQPFFRVRCWAVYLPKQSQQQTPSQHQGHGCCGAELRLNQRKPQARLDLGMEQPNAKAPLETWEGWTFTRVGRDTGKMLLEANLATSNSHGVKWMRDAWAHPHQAPPEAWHPIKGQRTPLAVSKHISGEKQRWPDITKDTGIVPRPARGLIPPAAQFCVQAWGVQPRQVISSWFPYSAFAKCGSHLRGFQIKLFK